VVGGEAQQIEVQYSTQQIQVLVLFRLLQALTHEQTVTAATQHRVL
jgi:methylglyoxal synthase